MFSHNTDNMWSKPRQSLAKMAHIFCQNGNNCEAWLCICLQKTSVCSALHPDGFCLRCMVAEIINYDTWLLHCIMHCMSYFREDSGKGIWCSLLVPTAVIVSSFKSSTVGQYGCVL